MISINKIIFFLKKQSYRRVRDVFMENCYDKENLEVKSVMNIHSVVSELQARIMTGVN